MTEEMRNLSRVKGEELSRHTVREKQVYDSDCSRLFRLTATYSVDIQGEGPGTGVATAFKLMMSISVGRALFRAPLVVVSRQRDCASSLSTHQMAWYWPDQFPDFYMVQKKRKKMKKKKFEGGGGSGSMMSTIDPIDHQKG
jgi:hypothetical protein